MVDDTPGWDMIAVQASLLGFHKLPDGTLDMAAGCGMMKPIVWAMDLRESISRQNNLDVTMPLFKWLPQASESKHPNTSHRL